MLIEIQAIFNNFYVWVDGKARKTCVKIVTRVGKFWIGCYLIFEGVCEAIDKRWLKSHIWQDNNLAAEAILNILKLGSFDSNDKIRRICSMRFHFDVHILDDLIAFVSDFVGVCL